MSAITLILLDTKWAETQKQTKRAAEPTISIFGAGFNLNSSAIRALGLKTGDLLLIAQDKQYPKDFYLMTHPRGFKLTQGAQGDGKVSQSSYFATICAALGYEGLKRIKFKLADKPETIEGFRCYAINTVNPLIPAAEQAADQQSGSTQSA